MYDLINRKVEPGDIILVGLQTGSRSPTGIAKFIGLTEGGYLKYSALNEEEMKVLCFKLDGKFTYFGGGFVLEDSWSSDSRFNISLIAKKELLDNG